MDILADGRLFQDGQLKFSDFSAESQKEIAKVFRELLLLVGRILARRESERAERAQREAEEAER